MKLKYGDDVEVRYFKDKPWKKGYKFLVHDKISTNDPYPYLVSDGERGDCFKYCRPARPDLEIDDKVWVRDMDSHDWENAHFSGWIESGYIICWAHGCTSHTTTKKLPWNYYRLTPPEDDE